VPPPDGGPIAAVAMPRFLETCVASILRRVSGAPEARIAGARQVPARSASTGSIRAARTAG
jgi:hypothetical protein